MNIGIDEIICTSEYYINDSEDLCYDAESISRPTKCINPECKCDIKPHYHSKSRNLLKDIKRNGKLTYINLTIKRYRCPECHRVFYEQFDFYDRKNFLTKRLREEIIKKSIAGESCYKISKEYKIDKKTIIRTIKDYFYSHVESNYETTKTGILLQTIKNKECITLLDLEKNKVIDVNESFGIHTISALTQSDCPFFVLDIEPSAFKTVTEESENTIAIHPDTVIQYVNETLKEQLTAENNEKGPDRELIKKYFSQKWTQLKKSGTLLLNKYFKKNPEHYNLYILKELLMDIYNICPTKEEAEVLLNAWFEVFDKLSKDKEKKECLYHIKKYILNHWESSYDKEIFSKTREVFFKEEKKSKRSNFDTIVKKGILTLHYNKENEPVFAMSKMAETKEKVQILYNKYQLDYNTELPIEFSHRLQAHIYLYLKYLKNNV